MSNLYKCYNVVSKNERVIDYNDVIKSKLSLLYDAAKTGKVSADGFISGLNADVVETLLSEDGTDFDEEGQQQIYQSNMETAVTKAEDIITNAKNEAQQVLEYAQAKAQELHEQAYDEARNLAMENCKIELEQQRAKLQMEYEEKHKILQLEYEELKTKLEPELVGVITDVFKKVIYTISDDHEDIILNLVNNVMHNAEISKQFIIKVSPEDYQFLLKNQGKIYCAMSKDVQLEIIEDLTMKKNQCVIESDVGVYDCSLDIQLENLIKEIKLLSCIE